MIRTLSFRLIPTAMLLAACGHSGGHVDSVGPLSDAVGVADPLLGLIGDPSDGKADSVEARQCKALAGNRASVSHTWIGAGNITGTRNETWTGGALFGQSPADHANTGFTSKDGSIVNGTPKAAPSTSLTCSDRAYLSPGWQFSNNVAGLDVNSTFDLTVTRQHKDHGSTVTMRVQGPVETTYADPRDDAASAYFDERAGTLRLTRHSVYGTADKPVLVTVTDGDRKVQFILTSDRSAPLTETIVRSLDGDRPVLERRVSSGALITEHGDGTNVRLTPKDLVYTADRASGKTSCRPSAGQLTIEVVPSMPSKAQPAVTIVRDFNGPAPASHVSCMPDGDGSCLEQARAAMDTYGPPSCLF